MSSVFPHASNAKATAAVIDVDYREIEGPIAELVRARSTISHRADKTVLVEQDQQTVAWPSTFAPNALVRFSLFGAHRTRISPDRIFQKNTAKNASKYVVADTAQYRIEYDGTEALNTDDLLVFLVCCAAARDAGDMGALVPISLNQCNRFLWKSSSGKNNMLFKQSLERLFGAYFRVKKPGHQTDRVRFFEKYQNDDSDPSNPVYKIKISADMAPMFSNDCTELDLVAMAHTNNRLARWMIGFYSTHNGQKDYSVADLQKMSGSTYIPLFKFRAKLKDAIAELSTEKTITNEKGETRTIRAMFGEGTTITKNDELHVVKLIRSMMIGPAKATQAAPINAPAPVVQPAPARVEAVAPTAKAGVFPTAKGQVARKVTITKAMSLDDEFVPIWDRDIDPSDDRTSDQRKYAWLRARNHEEAQIFIPKSERAAF